MSPRSKRANTAGKTAGRPKPGRPFAKGADARRGAGKKGRSGRKSLAWKALCRDLLHDTRAQDELRKAVRDRSTHGYAQLLKLLAGYAAGLPVQTVRIGGLLSVAQRIESLSDADLERFLAGADAELLTSLVTAAEEDEEDAPA